MKDSEQIQVKLQVSEESRKRNRWHRYVRAFSFVPRGTSRVFTGTLPRPASKAHAFLFSSQRHRSVITWLYLHSTGQFWFDSLHFLIKFFLKRYNVLISYRNNFCFLYAFWKMHVTFRPNPENKFLSQGLTGLQKVVHLADGSLSWDEHVLAQGWRWCAIPAGGGWSCGLGWGSPVGRCVCSTGPRTSSQKCGEGSNNQTLTALLPASLQGRQPSHCFKFFLVSDFHHFYFWT